MYVCLEPSSPHLCACSRERRSDKERAEEGSKGPCTYHSVQVLVVIGADRLPIQQHATPFQGVEVLQDVDAGALATARRPHERCHLSWGQAEGDILQGTRRHGVGPLAHMLWPQMQAGTLPSLPHRWPPECSPF